jgi:hypothetical protein
MTAQELSPLQRDVDEVVTTWPEVKARNVFGHRGYVREGRMFGFLALDGAAMKASDDGHAEALYARDGVVAFTYNGMPMRGWPVLPLRDGADLDAAIEEMHRAYEAVARPS